MNSRLKLLVVLLVIVSAVRLLIAAWDYFDSTPKLPSQARAARVEAKGKPFIEVSPEARIRLLEKVKGIKIEDTIDYVLEQLGRPQADGAPTTQPSDAVPMRTASRVLTYYIRKRNQNSFDELFDEHIHVFFDRYDCVAYVYVKLRQEKPFEPLPPVPSTQSTLIKK